MAEMMRLQIVTPDEAFFDGEVSMVELNTADGEAGIYPKHIPMVVAVAPGVLKIHGADGVKKAALLSGFLQILPEKVTILAEACEWPENIDGKRANEARIRAEPLHLKTEFVYGNKSNLHPRKKKRRKPWLSISKL